MLEIGCGTGQLTRQLAGRGFELDRHRHRRVDGAGGPGNVTDAAVRFQVSSFEDFAGGGPFDLIVSATAFHWVDPAWVCPRPRVCCGRAAAGPADQRRTLSRAAAAAVLHELWLRYNRPSQEWTSQPAWLTGLREARLFGGTVEVSHTRSLRLPAERVLGVERTRATFLSWPEPDQAAFTADLEALLEPSPHLDVIQETFLAMAASSGC